MNKLIYISGFNILTLFLIYNVNVFFFAGGLALIFLLLLRICIKTYSDCNLSAGHVIQTEAAVWRCSVKKVFLETLLKKRLWHRYFPVDFAKFLRTPFVTEHLRWLLLFKAIYVLHSFFFEHSRAFVYYTRPHL